MSDERNTGQQATQAEYDAIVWITCTDCDGTGWPPEIAPMPCHVCDGHGRWPADDPVVLHTTG